MSAVMYLASTDAANELLSRDPLALLIGMLLDQQVPMEKAFTSPEVLVQRLAERDGTTAGRLDAGNLAGMDPGELEELFRAPPALHRFPKAMAGRVQHLARDLVQDYDGDTRALWQGATSGSQLLQRIAALPGFGEQKARIFVALLGKQWGVTPRGWRQVAGPYGEKNSHVSIADVVDEDSRQAVREYKRQRKAEAKAAAGGVAPGAGGAARGSANRVAKP